MPQHAYLVPIWRRNVSNRLIADREINLGFHSLLPPRWNFWLEFYLNENLYKKDALLIGSKKLPNAAFVFLRLRHITEQGERCVSKNFYCIFITITHAIFLSSRRDFSEIIAFLTIFGRTNGGKGLVDTFLAHVCTAPSVSYRNRRH